MNRKLNLAVLISLLFILTGLSGCIGDSEESSGYDELTDWSAVADDNETYSKTKMLGTKHIIHFSASWCTPCRDVMHKVTGELPNATFMVISTDVGDDDWETLSDWHTQVNDSNDTHNVDAPFMVNAELANSIDIKNTPTLIVVNEKGEITARQVGDFETAEDIREFWG
jgi:thiol-disulfide isomerase/thioredoxin